MERYELINRLIRYQSNLTHSNQYGCILGDFMGSTKFFLLKNLNCKNMTKFNVNPSNLFLAPAPSRLTEMNRPPILLLISYPQSLSPIMATALHLPQGMAFSIYDHHPL